MGDSFLLGTPDRKRVTRESYDRVADQYADKYFHELQSKPVDRDLLDRLSDAVRDCGYVCDLGCGPGHVARYLSGRGTEVFGIDLSPRMVARARLLNPHIRFHVGDMEALPLPGEALAGIVALYAIVNTPLAALPLVFREMTRVLEPHGLLLLSFHIGGDILRPEELLGQPNSMDFYFFRPAVIVQILEEAGFAVEDVIEREPHSPEVEYQSRRAYLFARKPGQ